MKHINDDGKYILKLESGEEIVESVAKFCRNKNIKSCFFMGIGAVNHAEIAHYSLSTKQYSYKTLDQDLEISGITGNVSYCGSEIIVHCHITLADDKFCAYSGHLKNATVSVTCEIWLISLINKINRKYDVQTGLKLLDL